MVIKMTGKEVFFVKGGFIFTGFRLPDEMDGGNIRVVVLSDATVRATSTNGELGVKGHVRIRHCEIVAQNEPNPKPTSVKN
ncbi:MAG: hypothetical protein WC631_02120 [Candidatus Paceibacterota bacterium]|jgi:hypothetical protein